MNSNIYVINRNNEIEELSFDAIKNRIKHLISIDNLKYVSAHRITIETISKIYDNITTSQLDIESSKICAHLEIEHFNYGLLGGRILISNHYKTLKHMKLNTYSDRLLYLYDKLDKTFFNPDFISFVNQNKEIINNIQDSNKDYYINYFAFKTLEKSYLIKHNLTTIETPQDLWLRVSISIHFRSKEPFNIIIQNIKNTYELMSNGLFTHATPTLFNSGTNYEQDSSCFLLGTDDSLTGIFKTISDVAQISKWAGGIGIHISNIRSNGSMIHTTNGLSNGIIPMLKVYNEVARYVNQGGKRKGSIAIYLEPHHADIEHFIDIKKNTGAETERARDLFTALWLSDRFMRTVEKDGDWYIMCPNECPLLNEVYDKVRIETKDVNDLMDDIQGCDYTNLYNSYVRQGKYKSKVKARELWHKIMESQIETGVPYILYKDNVNRKSNQSNIGIIKSSNLCAEIVEYSDKDNYAVCNLASIAVNKFVKYTKEIKSIEDIKEVYDFSKLREVVRTITYNLNQIIDINYYPVEETRKTNMKYRPIGIGIQGLGDLYYQLRLSYSDNLSKQLDAFIMETIYYSALEESVELSKKYGSYDKFEGSPASLGLLQFDLFEMEQGKKIQYNKLYSDQEWNLLKDNIKTYGLRNSLLTALMPTATTSQILGNNECFEPYSSSIYKRTTLAGEFQVVNKHLINELIDMNLWNEQIRNNIIINDGSIQNINLDNNMKEIYKTIWEIKQKDIIDHAIARSPFVDQSQSMNLFFGKPNITSLHSALLYGWKNGLKTGCYYLRSRPAVEAIKFSMLNIDCAACSS